MEYIVLCSISRRPNCHHHDHHDHDHHHHRHHPCGLQHDHGLAGTVIQTLVAHTVSGVKCAQTHKSQDGNDDNENINYGEEDSDDEDAGNDDGHGYDVNVLAWKS